ncbi:MAG: glycosyltransferase family 4 protein [Planctomycetia bacterium]|nr:glycosyltransferase family 4 protein [Planctomycetia bacterium]
MTATPGAVCGRVRLGIFATHPIQYFAPVWRILASQPDIDLHVYFFSDHSVRGGVDPEFGVPVEWDVPVLEGYAHTFLRRDADLSRPRSVSLTGAAGILREERLDAVLVHGYMHAFERQAVSSARAAGLATLARGEFTDAPPPGGRSSLRSVVRDAVLRRFYRHIDAFCVIGTPARRHLQRLGVPAERLFHSPYSVDTALFEKQRVAFPREASRAALGLAPEDFCALLSAKLIPRKAPLLLVEAARLLARPRLRLVFVGDGEQRAAVESAARAAVGDRFRIAGFVNQRDIGRFYAAADALVLPSVQDTWGLVVNEAMQFGVPAIVSSAVGCAEDLVTDGETGFVFPAGDAAALASRLASLLDSPGAAARLGMAARRRISAWSSDAAASGIRAAVQTAISGRPEGKGGRR